MVLLVGAIGLLFLSFYTSISASAPVGQGKGDGACLLSGRVISQTTGDGVNSARVSLIDSHSAPKGLLSPWYFLSGTGGDDDPRDSHQAVNTRSDGTFCFAAPTPGNYLVSASKPGYLDSSYVEDGPIVEISAPSQATASPVIRMSPLGAITGVVVDSSGDPAANVNVVAVRRAEVQGRMLFMPVQGAQSTDLGAFRIGKLVPGTYYLYAQPLPLEATGSRPSVVRTYYPAALALRDATPLQVEVGGESSGITVHLQSASTSHVAGRVVGPTESWAGSAIDLRHADEDPIIILYGGENLSSEGEFEFGDVSPGRYLLSVRSTRGGGSSVVEVGSSDLRADVQFVNNVALRGTWAIEGSETKNMPIPAIALVTADTVLGSSYVATVQRNGTFSVSGIFPGKYFIRITTSGDEYLNKLRIGGKDCPTANIDLTTGHSPRIELTLGTATTTLAGRVDEGQGDTESANRPYARVVVVPREGRIDGTDIRFAVSDGAGNFLFKNIAPGDYDVLALLPGDGRLLQNAAGLHAVALKLGTQVSLRERVKNEALTLSAVSSEAVAKVLDLNALE